MRKMLSGADRRSIADSNRARAQVDRDPSLVGELVELTRDDDWLVALRALDLLEKLAHDHPDWIEPHKAVFIGPLADSDKWEVKLQIVRALPLFRWTPTQQRRVQAILLACVEDPQTFVRAWALDSLASLSTRNAKLRATVERYLRVFERSPSKALQARARSIRQRMAGEASSAEPGKRRAPRRP
jgi:HEAT repeat protein